MKTEIKDRIIDPASQEGRNEVRHASNVRLTDVTLPLGIACLFVVSALIWSSFDYRFPTQDEAAHIMNSIKFSELLSHCRPWHYQWWHQFFAASPFYPPFVYLVGGLCMLILHQSRMVEHSYMALFSGVMTMSVYAVTRLAGGGRVAACTAALFLTAYPVVSWLSHTFFLDMPATAMTAVALLSLLWWRRSASPRWRLTLICSLMLAAACLTKQVATVYLLPVGCYFVFVDLIVFSIQRGTLEAKARFRWLVHAIAMAIFTFLIGLPFLATNFQWNIERIRHNVQAFSDLSADHTWLNSLETYLREIPAAMSPAFLLLFVVAVFSVRKQAYRRLVPVIVSAIGGLCLLSALPSEVQDERYLGPFLLGAAVLSGLFLEGLIVSDTTWKKIAGKAILALAAFKFVDYNFAPSLIPLAPLRWPFALSEHDGNPQQYADWGYTFILTTIQSVDGNKPVYLNVVPNHDVMHVNGLSLYLKEKGFNSILPTTSRVWTILGDRVRFDETIAGYPMWYLIKTGDNGLGLCDQQSRDDYEKLITFVRDGKKYRLVAQKMLPDDSQMMLYRRKF